MLATTSAVALVSSARKMMPVPKPPVGAPVVIPSICSAVIALAVNALEATTVSAEAGTLVPIPRRLLTLSQVKLEASFDRALVPVQKATPFAVPLPVRPLAARSVNVVPPSDEVSHLVLEAL